MYTTREIYILSKQRGKSFLGYDILVKSFSIVFNKNKL